MVQDEIERNMGVQPLDSIMLEHALGNHDLVNACDEPITHKAVQRARRGRRLTKHMQRRMVEALNRAIMLRDKSLKRSWEVGDLFTY
jgi:hypothetical protein